MLHAIIESAVISLLTKDFERFSLGLNWEQWFVVHRVGSVILLSVGVIFGLQQGRLWWRILYVEKHFNLKKKNQLIILDFDHTVFNTTKYVNELKIQMGEKFPPENVLLGCTHYPLVHHLFVRALPSSVHVYDQAAMVATSLKDYLLRHLEIDGKILKDSSRTFVTTGDALEVEKKASAFYGKSVSFEQVKMTF